MILRENARIAVPTVRFGMPPVPVLLVLLILAISGCAYAVVGFLHFDGRVPPYQLLDDPASYAGVRWYTGLFSNIGVLMWCASAAVSAFAGLLIRHQDDPEIHALSRFLLVFAVISLWMTFDDLLLIHEQLARLASGREAKHFAEGLIFGIMAIAGAFCLWRFRDIIRQHEPGILLAAIVSLGLSVAIDVGFQLELGGNNLFRETVLSVSWGASAIDILEEILKLNGAMLWCLYFSRAALQSVRRAAGMSHNLA